MSSYESRLHRRNVELAMVEAKYVQAEIEVVIKEWVTAQEDAATRANQPPYRLAEPLSPAEIVQLIVEKLSFIGGTPLQGELVPGEDDE